MTAEEWRPIPGFSMYDVSDRGRIRSWWRRGKRGSEPKLISGSCDDQGYRQALVQDSDRRKFHRSFHSLVLLAFVGPRPEGLETRHLNGVPDDNRLSNLTYGTHSENIQDVLRHGNHHYAKRTHCKNGHEFTPENTWLRPSPKSRVCRTCKNARSRAAA